MKRLLAVLLIFFPSLVLGEAATLNLRNINGKWDYHYGFGVEPPVDPTRWSLEVLPTGGAKIRAEYADGKIIEGVSSEEGITYFDDLMQIKFLGKTSGVYSKLVLSGWKNHGTKLMFGMLYYYNGNQLFNGIPLSFIQETEKR